MRFILIILFPLFTTALLAQSKSDKIYGTWVACKVTYANGTELKDDNIYKYAYRKDIFTYPDKFNSSDVFYENGNSNTFNINNGYLQITSPEGGAVNTLQIESVRDTLILLEAGLKGFNDPMGLKYYFVPETVYQGSIPLKPSNIRSVIAGDTVYKQSSKIYAQYNGDSFQHYIYNEIKKSINMDRRAAYLKASFIVSKTGFVDSAQIIEGVDEKFDKVFVKAFNRAGKNWKPAVLNGKNVTVEMSIDLRYFLEQPMMEAVLATEKANAAYSNKQFDVALHYYDRALGSAPYDLDNLFRRGVCQIILGNGEKACEDWNKIEALGGSAPAEALLVKYCK